MIVLVNVAVTTVFEVIALIVVFADDGLAIVHDPLVFAQFANTVVYPVAFVGVAVTDALPFRNTYISLAGVTVPFPFAFACNV